MTIIPIKVWIAILTLVALFGCATTFDGLCAVQMVGQTDSGLAVLRTHCEAQ